MSVSYALLGLLEQEPNHGYELKRRYDRYFAGERPLAYGQVYSTLARLARDGRVSEGGSLPGEGPERKLYAITPAGTEVVEAWLTTPEAPEPHLQTVLAVKVILSLLLERPAEEYLDNQRRSHLARMRELTAARKDASLVDALLMDHAIFHLEADLRWIDLTTARLDRIAKEIRR